MVWICLSYGSALWGLIQSHKSDRKMDLNALWIRVLRFKQPIHKKWHVSVRSLRGLCQQLKEESIECNQNPCLNLINASIICATLCQFNLFLYRLLRKDLPSCQHYDWLVMQPFNAMMSSSGGRREENWKKTPEVMGTDSIPNYFARNVQQQSV